MKPKQNENECRDAMEKKPVETWNGEFLVFKRWPHWRGCCGSQNRGPTEAADAAAAH